MRLWDILFLDLLPYYRRHAPKINRISGVSMVEFVSGLCGYSRVAVKVRLSLSEFLNAFDLVHINIKPF